MKCDLAIFLFVALFTLQINAEDTGAVDPRRNLRRAVNEGAQAQYTFSVEDSTGTPVSNATVSVGFVMLNRKSNRVVGKTNSEGIFVAKSIAQWEVGARVSKKGYYESKWALFLAKDEQSVSDGCWLPWNPTIPIVLREIRNPISMHVKRFNGKLPNGATVGFDCKIGEFLPPSGNGKTEDFNITLEASGIPLKNAKHSLKIDAPDPDGGFLISKLYQASAFKSDYHAPEFGYKTNLSAISVYDVRRGVTGSVLYGSDEYLMFKSRIKRDNKGKIVSANYGKIFSEVEFRRGSGETEYVGIEFLYYFNPISNNRNLEFDGKNNLFFPQNKFSPYEP